MPVWYRDSDIDGFGDPTIDMTACDQPAGYVSDNTDCDDTSGAVNPGAREASKNDPVCSDAIDNDCDGAIDEADSGCRENGLPSLFLLLE
jgi:hypothetical protein